MKDRVAVVTGAGSGIGAATARRFAKEGARVAVWDRDRELAGSVAHAIVEQGGDAIPVVGDVGDARSVQRVISEVLARYRTIHILVNNAGFGDDAPVTEMTDAQWESVIRVCLTGPFLCCRAVAPTMIAQRYGRIINIASRAHLGEAGKANYCSAKAGVLGLTRSLAVELGPHEITVNAVAPGMVRTERVLNQPGFAGLDERAKQRQLIKRAGEPEDIVNGIMFFAAEASSFVTGDLMYVTGGRLT